MATSEKIKLENVRLSFPHLWTPKSFRPDQPPRFEAAFLLDPADKAHKAVIKKIKATAEELLVDHFGEGKVPKATEFCYGKGDKKDYDGYAGMWFITSNNRTRPAVVARDMSPLVEEDGKPYAGCYVNATITLWVQDNEFGKRINANLRAVQFAKDGDAFGVEPVSVDDEFDVLEDDDDFLDD
jgi:hypothetical protein